MQLSQQQQTLSDNAGRLERAMANTRNLFSSIGNMFQTGMQLQQNSMMMSLNKAISSGTVDPNSDEAKQAYQQIVTMNQNFMNNPGIIGIDLMNKSLEIVNQGKLQQIKDMENQIELERKSLETQLAAAQKELESVEKAEEKAIDRAAPKFA